MFPSVKVINISCFLSLSLSMQLYTNCRCISGSQSYARPAACPNSCPHLLLPVILVISLASLIACLTHNPMYMMVLRWGWRTTHHNINACQFIHLKKKSGLLFCTFFKICVIYIPIWSSSSDTHINSTHLSPVFLIQCEPLLCSGFNSSSFSLL